MERKVKTSHVQMSDNPFCVTATCGVVRKLPEAQPHRFCHFICGVHTTASPPEQNRVCVYLPVFTPILSQQKLLFYFTVQVNRFN